MKRYKNFTKKACIFFTILFLFNIFNTHRIKADDLSQTKKKIIEMNSNIKSSKEEISKISNRVREVNESINNKEEEIKKLNNSLIEIKNSEKKINLTLGEKNIVLDSRLREKYKNGYINEIQILLDSKSFKEFFIKANVIGKIIKEDRETIETIRLSKEELESLKEKTSETLAKVKTEKDNLNQERVTLNKAIDDQEEKLVSLNKINDDLNKLMKSQEIDLLKDAKRIINDENSKESDLAYAQSILNSLDSRLSTSEAKSQSKILFDKANNLKAQIEEQRRIAEEEKNEKLRQEAIERANKLEEERKKAEIEAKRIRDEAQKVADASKVTTVKKPTNPSPIVKPTPIVSPVTPNPPIASNPSKGYIDFYVTYYTDLPEENGGWSITASGEAYRYGVVANNVHPMYTNIYLEGLGNFQVLDRGGSEFYASNRLDIFIPRKSGESDSQYKSRVNGMGRRVYKGYIK